MKRLPTLCLLFALAQPVSAREVTLVFDQSLDTQTGPLPYQLSMKLEDVAPTRIAVDAVLDLTDAQIALAGQLTNTELADLCNARLTLETLEAKANGPDISVGGQLTMQTFRCIRALGQTPERQESLASNTLSFTAAASARLKDQCVYFDLSDLDLSLQESVLGAEAGNGLLRDARDIFLKASALVLQRNPICPALPPELSSVDPRYVSGGTVEIGDGGIGIALKGSFDVSPETILDVLRVLQQKGTLPPPP